MENKLIIYSLFILMSFVFQIPKGNAAKILLAPWPHGSHVNELLEIGNELLKNGHDVKIMLSASFPKTAPFYEKTKGIDVLEYEVKYNDMYTLPPASQVMSESLVGVKELIGFRTLIEGLDSFCYNAMEDLRFHEQVKAERFDLAIVDAMPVTRCYYILFYKLNIPYVSQTANPEPWLYRNPAIPSFEPFSMSYPAKSQEMTFIERLVNLYHLLDWSVSPRIPYLEDSLVTKYAPEKPAVTLDWLAGQSLIWLISTDIAVDYPKPRMSNEIDVGGLCTKPAKALEVEVLKLVDKAEDGVIVVSFGSFDVLSHEMYRKVIEALRMVPKTMQIFLRYTRDHPSGISIPPNLKLMTWLPQNDLLGHPKTRLFITHTGLNSQFEALYHAVPTIMFHLFGDQPYNAKRGEYKGHGVMMDILNFDPEELAANIDRVLNNDSLQTAVAKDSRIFRSRAMNPRETAVHWIEHVLEFGGKHLRSHGLDLPWYQYLMLDIVALFLVVLTLVMTVIVLVVKWICLKICSKNIKDKTE